MTTKYLEVDSTFRDRQQWPLPSEFQLIVSQSGTNDARSAYDPVSLATPTVQWVSNRFIALLPGSVTLTANVTKVGIGETSTDFVVIISAPPGTLQQDVNYYIHSVLVGPTGLVSRIMNYSYLGNNLAQLTLMSPLQLNNGDIVTISDPTDLSVNRIFVPSSNKSQSLTNPNKYANTILYDETVNLFSPITYFDELTGLITTENAIPGWLPTDNFSIRTQPPSGTGTTTPTSTTTLIGLGPIGLTDLVGSFIRIPPSYPNIPPRGEISRIAAYNPTTFIATVNPPFSVAANNVPFEILAFNYDNFQPFVYTGSAQNEFVNSTVSLKTLVLPNLILQNNGGGRPWRHPYVYVELTPLNYSTSHWISSNNPHSGRMLFRASVGNFDMFRTANFLLLTGDSMEQRVKFEVDTNFKFSVTLPDGTPLKTIVDEYYSPSPPNPEVQISALFEIKR